MISDADIIRTMESSSEQGLKLLMWKYMQPVYWHIRRLVVSHDDAQDASQETFVRVFKSFGSFRGDCSLRSWIYRIATNEALRAIGRRRGSTVSLDDDSVITIAADEHWVDMGDELAMKLQKAILSLPKKQQLAFSLRYYDELSFEEMAKVANSTADSMKACYHLAKEKIVKYIKEHD